MPPLQQTKGWCGPHELLRPSGHAIHTQHSELGPLSGETRSGGLASNPRTASRCWWFGWSSSKWERIQASQAWPLFLLFANTQYCRSIWWLNSRHKIIIVTVSPILRNGWRVRLETPTDKQVNKRYDNSWTQSIGSWWLQGYMTSIRGIGW